MIDHGRVLVDDDLAALRDVAVVEPSIEDLVRTLYAH